VITCRLLEVGNVQVMLKLMVVFVGELNMFADFGGFLTGSEMAWLKTENILLAILTMSCIALPGNQHFSRFHSTSDIPSYLVNLRC
jgi:hypothetical protein